MKTKLFLLVLLVILLSACGGDSAPELAWPEFESEEGGFAIQLPVMPEEQVQTVNSVVGDMDMHIFMVEDDGAAAYGVLYNVFPIEMDQEDEALSVMFDNSRDSAIANVGGELVSEKDISIDGYAGRHIVFSVPNSAVSGGGDGYLRLFWIDGYFYQVIALGPTGAMPVDTVNAFLDSFRLLP